MDKTLIFPQFVFQPPIDLCPPNTIIVRKESSCVHLFNPNQLVANHTLHQKAKKVETGSAPIIQKKRIVLILPHPQSAEFWFFKLHFENNGNDLISILSRKNKDVSQCIFQPLFEWRHLIFFQPLDQGSNGLLSISFFLLPQLNIDSM